MSSGAMDSGEGAVQPAPIDPLVSEISQTVPEVVTGVSEIERTAAKINTTIDHDVSEDIKPSNQGDTCRETEEEGVSVSMQANREMEFVKKPGEFTTEVFKIEIRNLPRYAGYKVSAADNKLENYKISVATEKAAGRVRIEAGQD